MIVPLFVGREKSVRALEEVMNDEKQILLLTQKNAAEDDPTAEGLHTIGTLATVLQLLKLPDQTVRVLGRGQGPRPRYRFFRPHRFLPGHGREDSGGGRRRPGIRGADAHGEGQFEQYIKLNKKIPSETLQAVAQIDDPAKLADTVASHLSVKIGERQALLETFGTTERLEKILSLIEAEIGVLQVERKIRSRVKRQMEKTQREYYLNEQLKAIQKELGEGEEGRDEMNELEERIRKTKLSKEAREKATAEVKKLRSMSPMSAEATVVRNYLDWLLSLPWGKKSKVKRDIVGAEKVLNDDHFGLEKGQGTHPGVPRCAAARRQAQGSDPVPGWSAGRGQDLARQVHRQGDGPRICPHVAGRHARRSRNPRSPQDLYRLHAWQDHPVHEEGQDQQSVVPAG